MNCTITQELNRHLKQLDAESALKNQEIKIADDIKDEYTALDAYEIIEANLGDEQHENILISMLAQIAVGLGDEIDEAVTSIQVRLNDILESAAIKQAKKEIADGVHDHVDDDDYSDDYLEACA